MLSANAKNWIEENIEVVETGDVSKIIASCRTSLIGEVLWAIYKAGIPLEQDPSNTQMWGIKSSDGYRTLSLGKHNKTNYNVNFTASEGMKGGMQIGFKSIQDCVSFIDNITQIYNWGADHELRPSKMVPNVYNRYKWTEVDTIYGKCYVTELAIDKYDPNIAIPRAQQNRSQAAKNRSKNHKWISFLHSTVDLDKILEDVIIPYLHPKGEHTKHTHIGWKGYSYRHKWVETDVLEIWNIECSSKEALEGVRKIEKLTGLQASPKLISGSIGGNDITNIYISFTD